MIEADFLVRHEDEILKVQHPLYDLEDEEQDDPQDRHDFEQDLEVAEWKERT